MIVYGIRNELDKNPRVFCKLRSIPNWNNFPFSIKYDFWILYYSSIWIFNFENCQNISFQVQYKGAPEDATLVLNKGFSTPFNVAQRKISFYLFEYSEDNVG